METTPNVLRYYRELGLASAPPPSQEAIRSAYKQKALQFHPDKSPGNAEAENRFKEIAKAYQGLKALYHSRSNGTNNTNNSCSVVPAGAAAAAAPSRTAVAPSSKTSQPQAERSQCEKTVSSTTPSRNGALHRTNHNNPTIATCAPPPASSLASQRASTVKNEERVVVSATIIKVEDDEKESGADRSSNGHHRGWKKQRRVKVKGIRGSKIPSDYCQTDEEGGRKSNSGSEEEEDDEVLDAVESDMCRRNRWKKGDLARDLPQIKCMSQAMRKKFYLQFEARFVDCDNPTWRHQRWPSGDLFYEKILPAPDSDDEEEGYSSSAEDEELLDAVEADMSRRRNRWDKGGLARDLPQIKCMSQAMRKKFYPQFEARFVNGENPKWRIQGPPRHRYYEKILPATDSDDEEEGDSSSAEDEEKGDDDDEDEELLDAVESAMSNRGNRWRKHHLARDLIQIKSMTQAMRKRFYHQFDARFVNCGQPTWRYQGPPGGRYYEKIVEDEEEGDEEEDEELLAAVGSDMSRRNRWSKGGLARDLPQIKSMTKPRRKRFYPQFDARFVNCENPTWRIQGPPGDRFYEKVPSASNSDDEETASDEDSSDEESDDSEEPMLVNVVEAGMSRRANVMWAKEDLIARNPQLKHLSLEKRIQFFLDFESRFVNCENPTWGIHLSYVKIDHSTSSEEEESGPRKRNRDAEEEEVRK